VLTVSTSRRKIQNLFGFVCHVSTVLTIVNSSRMMMMIIIIIIIIATAILGGKNIRKKLRRF
jgi:hypothetical protein